MARGSKTGGRLVGTPNKATMEIKEAARKYGYAALEQLNHIMTMGKTDAVKVAAARELLDRAYGKPAQAITTEQDQGVQRISHEFDQKTLEYYRRNVLASVGVVE
jgi:hypothetical protein